MALVDDESGESFRAGFSPATFSRGRSNLRSEKEISQESNGDSILSASTVVRDHSIFGPFFQQVVTVSSSDSDYFVDHFESSHGSHLHSVPEITNSSRRDSAQHLRQSLDDKSGFPVAAFSQRVSRV